MVKRDQLSQDIAAHRVNLPLTDEAIAELRAGDFVELSGVLYVARDQAHARLAALLEKGRPLPFDIRGETVYYAGPSPAPPGKVVGSIGPTTAKRMDPFTPALLDAGLRGMIGKGPRSAEVVEAIVRVGAVYFVATGGAAAYLAGFVKAVEIVAYEDMGPEAIFRVRVEALPVTVGIDSKGESCLSPLKA